MYLRIFVVIFYNTCRYVECNATTPPSTGNELYSRSSNSNVLLLVLSTKTLTTLVDFKLQKSFASALLTDKPE